MKVALSQSNEQLLSRRRRGLLVAGHRPRRAGRRRRTARGATTAASSSAWLRVLSGKPSTSCGKMMHHILSSTVTRYVILRRQLRDTHTPAHQAIAWRIRVLLKRPTVL
eukprot:4294118-Pleurochrysis_carterae.AAC.1